MDNLQKKLDLLISLRLSYEDLIETFEDNGEYLKKIVIVKKDIVKVEKEIEKKEKEEVLKKEINKKVTAAKEDEVDRRVREAKEELTRPKFVSVIKSTEYTGLGKDFTYNLLKSNRDLPFVLEVGTIKRINIELFLKWLDEQTINGSKL